MVDVKPTTHIAPTHAAHHSPRPSPLQSTWRYIWYIWTFAISSAALQFTPSNFVNVHLVIVQRWKKLTTPRQQCDDLAAKINSLKCSINQFFLSFLRAVCSILNRHIIYNFNGFKINVIASNRQLCCSLRFTRNSFFSSPTVDQCSRSWFHLCKDLTLRVSNSNFIM